MSNRKHRLEITLVTGRTIGQGETIESKLSSEYMGYTAICEMNREDMEALGAKDGDTVKVSTEEGEVVVYARSSSIDKGIAFIPLGPWVNAIVPEGTDSTGMPAFKGFESRVEKTDEQVLDAKQLIRRMLNEV
ncbi:MAG: molybdopterin dinucleotide binding domain-containing protein [Archaeoglobaceae archaeon]